MWKISKGYSQDLGFAIDCLHSQAVNLDEFKLWLYRVIKEIPIDEIPLYIYDLVEIECSIDIYKIMNFVPSGDLSQTQDDALTGIAFLRSVDVYDPPISKNKALKALEKHPEIYQRFQHFFPFVELPSV